MKFLKLSLLSQKERRAYQLDLSAPRTVLVAGNGLGKSAILKSLYETFGARPHKVDKSWTDARVTSLVEFELNGLRYAAMKHGDAFSIFDAALGEIVNTSHITAQLGPAIGRLLDFKLVLADKREHVRTPPPSYAFAPFYVDQDRSWQKPWDSFKDLAMFPASAKSLSEYHSGLRPNAYYEAKAERDLLSAEMTKTDAERKAVDQALLKIRESMPATPIDFDMDAFRGDTDRLVSQSQALHNEQARYRTDLASVNEEYQLWADHVAVVQSALSEIDEAFATALEHPADVECPMCGEHYQNHIADQFDLVADKDDLVAALQAGRQNLKELEEKRSEQRRKIEGVSAALVRVQQTLTIHREDISLRDIVVAEGRNEAQRVLKERLSVLDAEYGEKQRRMADAEQRMKAADSRQRKLAITQYFASALGTFNEELDVRIPEGTNPSIQGVHTGRGSAGPRGLAAYYYAFLHTSAKYSTSAFCPIVVDAPNQQGQDRGHLQQIMQFLLTRMPTEAQVIVGTEAVGDLSGAAVVDISHQKERVLRAEAYDQTLEYVRPFLRQASL
ncbi:MAG: hypothetical protein ACKVP3_15615 [Hyphomicrobiaceae bacterium]